MLCAGCMLDKEFVTLLENYDGSQFFDNAVQGSGSNKGRRPSGSSNSNPRLSGGGGGSVNPKMNSSGPPGFPGGIPTSSMTAAASLAKFRNKKNSTA